MTNSRERTLSEDEFQVLWNELPDGGEFRTEDNHRVIIRSTGVWNIEAGPDFKECGIEIENRKYTGDIELHLKASDWFAHGHQNDPAYRNVILHVVMENDLRQEQREKMPPMLVVKPKSFKNSKGSAMGRCAAYFSSIEATRTKGLFAEAGLQRFFQKRNALLRQMLLEGAEKAWLRSLFDAAGYKQNRKVFAELFDRIMEYPEDLRKEHFQVLLWGESDLLPDPAIHKLHPEILEFAEKNWNQWWSLRKMARDKLPWKRSGRPVNSPERRIAFLSGIAGCSGEGGLEQLYWKVRERSPDEIAKEAVQAVQIKDLLWDNFINFKTKRKSPASVSGNTFSLEAAVNVVLPALHAAVDVGCFEECDNELKERLKRAWLLLPATQDNAIIRTARELWFEDNDLSEQVLNTAAARQGVIHIYREYCQPCQIDCASCKFFNSL
jgi:hypothetical protein